MGGWAHSWSQSFAALQTALFAFSSCPQPHPVPLAVSGAGLPSRCRQPPRRDGPSRPVLFPPGTLEMECTPKPALWNMLSENRAWPHPSANPRVSVRRQLTALRPGIDGVFAEGHLSPCLLSGRLLLHRRDGKPPKALFSLRLSQKVMCGLSPPTHLGPGSWARRGPAILADQLGPAAAR